MACSDEPASGRKRKRASGHEYTDVRISNHARVQLGDTYHLGLNDPLARLPLADDAAFNALAKQHEPTCLADTRVELLEEIHSWADGRDERCIFWLRGLAGTGKSTIARTVARRYCDEHRLAASFFFSRGGGDVGHASRFVTSIAVQLADNMPASRQHINDAIAERSDIARQSLRDQWHHLVLRPLSKMCKSGQEPETHITVVDALDECEGDNNIRLIVQLLAEARLFVGTWLRVLLTSRPEVPIRSGFRAIADAEHRDFVLHNISPPVVDRDIFIYLEYTLRLIGQECDKTADWPGKEVIKRLTQNASGLFIWAATACRYIQQGGQFVVDDRLQALLKDDHLTDASPTEGSSDEASSTDDPLVILPNRHLNVMYLTVLQGPVQKYKKSEKKKWYTVVKEILGSIILLFSPLSASSLGRLRHLSVHDVHHTLSELHSILNVPEDHSRPLRLHHPSFRDFLLDRGRCGDAFWVEEQQAHAALAEHCIRVMSSSLKQDVCEVGAPGALTSEMDRAQLKQCIAPEVQYACVYWIEHLTRSGRQLHDGDTVHTFLTEHCLHWLEALGWLSKVSEGIYAISSLESITQASACPGLYAFVHDMKRFVLYIRAAIEQAPLQVYCSGLVFAPSGSIVKQQFAGQIPRWMERLPQVDRGWGAVMQTLEGHLSYVNAVAFSADGKVVASASYDKTVKLWDAGTGAVIQTLEGHSHSVNAVAFSPDGKVVASASDDETVKLWDADTGAVMQTLEGHSSWVNAVAFSADDKVVASASSDETVKLWDAGTGAVMQTHTFDTAVRNVSFSDDGVLFTDRGSIRDSTCSAGAETQHNSLPNIFVDQQWLSYGSHKLIWLPPEYRGAITAVHEGVIALGKQSGHLSLLTITV